MKLILTRIYDETGSGREVKLHSFDLETDGVSSPAEIDVLVKKLTELRAEMIGFVNGEKDMDQVVGNQ